MLKDKRVLGKYFPAIAESVRDVVSAMLPQGLAMLQGVSDEEFEEMRRRASSLDVGNELDQARRARDGLPQEGK